MISRLCVVTGNGSKSRLRAIGETFGSSAASARMFAKGALGHTFAVGTVVFRQVLTALC